MTAWRRAARRHQSQWHEQHGWPPGLQRQSKQQGRGFRPIGSPVDEGFAREHGVNFASEAARRAVAERLASPELHETLDDTRLYCDLLSSMPMCSNLFGSEESFPEAPREQIAESMRALIAFDSIVCVDPAVLLRAVWIYEVDRLDFAEAYLIACAESTGVGPVASFDRNISGTHTVERIEPHRWVNRWG